MTDDTFIKMDLIFGHVEIVTTEWRDGNDLAMGGYSITFDCSGEETSRTRNEENCRLVGYYEVIKPSWLERLFGI